MSHQKKILKNTALISFFILISRICGFIRDILILGYLGAGNSSDAFFTAYKIPNSLRKIFAEGSLSAVFTPRIVSLIKTEGHRPVYRIMMLNLFFFESLVLVICVLIMIYAHNVILFVAPGFSHDQVESIVPLVRIIMPFIFFISSSALLAGALQAINHFFIPAISQIIINLIVISGLVFCNMYKFPVSLFCTFYLIGGLIQLIMHCIMFRNYFSYDEFPRIKDYRYCLGIIGAFIVSLPGVSITEVALFIDTSFASYLQSGSLSLLYYAQRFSAVPLGVFAVAFSTVLLPHFSRISTYSPRRLHFYAFESMKFAFWILFPIVLLMLFFAHDIFSTFFVTKLSEEQIIEVASLLQINALGIFFYAVNKIISTIFYAMHITWLPSCIALGTALFNITLNWILIDSFQSTGLAAATIIATITQTVLSLFILRTYYGFQLYSYAFYAFVARYITQLACCSMPFIGAYYILSHMITSYCSSPMSSFFLKQMGLWMWVTPLIAIFPFVLFYFRSFLNIRLYFLQ